MKTSKKTEGKVINIKDGKSVEIELTILEMITEFHPSISHLGSLEVKNIDALIAISKANKVAKQELTEYDEIRVKLSEVSCEKDDNGKPVIKDNKYVYADDKTQFKVMESIAELQKKKIKITVNTIQVKSLEGVVGLTANTILGLREMIII